MPGSQPATTSSAQSQDRRNFLQSALSRLTRRFGRATTRPESVSGAQETADLYHSGPCGSAPDLPITTTDNETAIRKQHDTEQRQKYESTVQEGIDTLNWGDPSENTIHEWHQMADRARCYAFARMPEVGLSPYRREHDARFQTLDKDYQESQSPGSTVNTNALKYAFYTLALDVIAYETDLMSKLKPHESVFNAMVYGARTLRD